MMCDECLYYKMCGDRDDDISGCVEFADRSDWVHLPCRVGTKVYALLGRKESITETFVEKIIVNRNNGTRLKLGANSMYETSARSIGKTVFFTREEAEKALEERIKK